MNIESQRRANGVVIPGRFNGGEVEPGVFHGGEIEPGTFHNSLFYNGLCGIFLPRANGKPAPGTPDGEGLPPVTNDRRGRDSNPS